MKMLQSALHVLSVMTVVSCASPKKNHVIELSYEGRAIFVTTSINNAYILGNDRIILKIEGADSGKLANALRDIKGKTVSVLIDGQMLAEEPVATSKERIDALEIHPKSFQRALELLGGAGVKVRALIDEAGDRDGDKETTLKGRFNNAGDH